MLEQIHLLEGSHFVLLYVYLFIVLFHPIDNESQANRIKPFRVSIYGEHSQSRSERHVFVLLLRDMHKHMLCLCLCIFVYMCL